MASDPGGLGNFIRVQRRLADLSLRQLAELSEVSNAYLSQVERGVYRPSAQVLKSIADALHLSAETLYSRAGLLDEQRDEPPLPTVEEAVRLDERLTGDQKETLLRIYREFASPDSSSS